MIVLDTNMVMAYLGEDPGVVERIRAAVVCEEEIIVPTIVIAEFLSYPYIDKPLAARIRQWLETGLTVRSFDLPLAEKAATISRETKMKLTDCIIAASALFHHAPLATRDQQFKKVSGLTILEW